jgi:RND family efflux transporter MFP subunit
VRAIAFPFHPAVGGSRRWTILSFAAVALVGLFFAGYWPRHVAEKRLAAETLAAQSRLPRAKVVTAVAAEGGRSMTLPGTLTPNEQAQVIARATGYVARRNVDIGDRVHAGDVLAELDTPELDQQLEQARAALTQKGAALEQAIANRDYARVTSARQDALLPDLTSKQSDDQAHAQVNVWEANVHAAQADVAAAQASVRQLAQLVSFGRVVAPFDGRITQRTTDVGSLVTAGGTAGSAPLFQIEGSDPMRVYVQVPQAFALSVKDGQGASVSIRQLPGRTFEGHVTRTAGSLDPTSRTLKAEVDVPNPTGELLGGMFAEVTFAVALSHPVVRVPSGAVITDASGVHVAAVDRGGQVHLVAVVRGLDDGREIELVSGLSGGEQVLASPGGDVIDGMRVEPVSGS